jgi:hypothetical protein
VQTGTGATTGLVLVTKNMELRGGAWRGRG